MWATNLKIFAVVILTVGVYTAVANMIPQVESEVPAELGFSADVTPEELVSAGEQLYAGAGGCTACHGLGTRAPNLLTDDRGSGAIGTRCATRVPGLTCKQYLHKSLTEPNEFVVEGFQPIMADLDRTLSPTQIWALVAFLESNGGDVSVTSEDIIKAEEQSGGSPAVAASQQAAGRASAGGTVDPMTLMRENQCLACHKIGSEGGPIGPDLTRIGASRDAEHIRRSILEPSADTSKGYEAVAGTMPATFGQQLTAGQLEAIVRYLGSQR